MVFSNVEDIFLFIYKEIVVLCILYNLNKECKDNCLKNDDFDEYLQIGRLASTVDP